MPQVDLMLLPPNPVYLSNKLFFLISLVGFASPDYHPLTLSLLVNDDLFLF